MKKYLYVKVRFTDVWSTDPSILDFIYYELQKVIPTCATRNEKQDIAGERISYQLHQLQNKDSQITDWITKLLCNNGFDPFDFFYLGSGAGDTSIQAHMELHFRKAIDV